MQSAQIFNTRGLSVATGEPVRIDYTPPGSKFLLCHDGYFNYSIFSIDTGCWVSSGTTPNEAIQNSEILFRKYKKSPNYTAWWCAACVQFETYLAYTWITALQQSLSPLPPNVQRSQFLSFA